MLCSLFLFYCDLQIEKGKWVKKVEERKKEQNRKERILSREKEGVFNNLLVVVVCQHRNLIQNLLHLKVYWHIFDDIV